MYNKEFEDALLKILGGLDRDMARFIKRNEKKLWQDIELPLTLKNALNTLTKNEMTQIRHNLDLQGLSSLNKSELANQLNKLIPTRIKNTMYNFDEERYSLLKRIIMKGGYIKIDDIDYSKADYFRERGIAFTGINNGEKVLAMPIKVMETFKEYDTFELKKIVDRNTLWIKLVTGMMFYYGFMDMDNIIEKLEEYTQTDCDFIEVFIVLNGAADYYIQIEQALSGFKDVRAMNLDWVIDDQSLRKDIPYYNFTKKELLRAANEDYIDRTPQTKRFSKCFKLLYEINDEEVDEVLRTINFMINNDASLGEIIEGLQMSFELDSIEDMQLVGQLLMEVHNNTRTWVLKGYAPTELEDSNKTFENNNSNIINITTRKKIGRNDPCPCGSGKKYKKCCGR